MNMHSEHQFEQTGGRRAERATVDATIQFRSGARRASVKVTDISPLGAHINGIFLVRVDDRFFLTIPGLEAIEARVAWIADFAFGCEFARPLSPVVLETVIQRLR